MTKDVGRREKAVGRARNGEYPAVCWPDRTGSVVNMGRQKSLPLLGEIAQDVRLIF